MTFIDVVMSNSSVKLKAVSLSCRDFFLHGHFHRLSLLSLSLCQFVSLILSLSPSVSMPVCLYLASLCLCLCVHTWHLCLSRDCVTQPTYEKVTNWFWVNNLRASSTHGRLLFYPLATLDQWKYVENVGLLFQCFKIILLALGACPRKHSKLNSYGTLMD